MKCICLVHSILTWFISTLQNTKLFSKIDLTVCWKGHCQNSYNHTFALYEFQSQKCSTLSNVSIDKSFHRLDFVYTSKDDVLIASEDEVERKDYFHEVFQHLQYYSLKNNTKQNAFSVHDNVLPRVSSC